MYNIILGRKIALGQLSERMSFFIPIKIAMLVFPIIAICISLPFLVFQYHRYGSIIAWRAIVVYTFVFYMLCAYFLVILPLPPVKYVASLTTPHYNLVPFTALKSFITMTVFNPISPGTWVSALKQPEFIQPFFNIVLTIPFGVYLRYYFKQPITKIIFYGFCLSLFFEVTQLSGLYGIYPRPYRLFDVDDLILNTSGAVIGGMIAPFLVKAFPSRDQMDQKSYARGKKVTIFRRFIAFIIDYGITGTIIETLLSLVGLENLAKNTYTLYLINTLIIFMIIPVLTHGQTIGKKLVKIRIAKQTGGPVGIGQLIFRQILIYYVVIPTTWGFNYMFIQVFSKMHQSQANLVLLGFLGLITVFIILNFIWGILFKSGYFFYDTWANTVQISDVKRNQDNDDNS